MTHNMNIEQAKLLLTRFYEGKTTPAEERLLAEFLRSDDVPEEFNADRQLFMQLSEIADTPMPNDIAEQIKTFVGNLTDHNNNTTQIETTAKRHTGFSFRMHTPPKIWSRIAAAVVLLVALGGGIFYHQQQTSPFRDTCATPEEAADAILYANDIIARSSAPLQRSTAIATEQINNMTETIIKIQPYINQ